MKRHQEHWAKKPEWVKNEDKPDYESRRNIFSFIYSVGIFLGSLYLIGQLIGTGLPQFIAVLMMIFSVLPMTISLICLGEEDC